MKNPTRDGKLTAHSSTRKFSDHMIFVLAVIFVFIAVVSLIISFVIENIKALVVSVCVGITAGLAITMSLILPLPETTNIHTYTINNIPGEEETFKLDIITREPTDEEKTYAGTEAIIQKALVYVEKKDGTKELVKISDLYRLKIIVSDTKPATYTRKYTHQGNGWIRPQGIHTFVTETIVLSEKDVDMEKAKILISSQ